MTDSEQCWAGKGTDHQCPKPARAALKTTRGTRFTTVVYWDDREAPKVAVKYCKEHAVATLIDLSSTLIELDD